MTERQIKNEKRQQWGAGEGLSRSKSGSGMKSSKAEVVYARKSASSRCSSSAFAADRCNPSSCDRERVISFHVG